MIIRASIKRRMEDSYLMILYPFVYLYILQGKEMLNCLVTCHMLHRRGHTVLKHINVYAFPLADASVITSYLNFHQMIHRHACTITCRNKAHVLAQIHSLHSWCLTLGRNYEIWYFACFMTI